MNANILNTIPDMPLDQAKQVGLEYITSIKSKKVMTTRLKRDIEMAPNSTEVCRILYMLELGREGLTTVGSKWAQHYRSNA